MKSDALNSTPRSPSTGHSRIQNRILRAMILHALLFLAILAAYGYVSFRETLTSSFQFWLLTSIVFLVLGVITFVFFRRIYLPILKFLGAIQVLENGQSGGEPDVQNDNAITPPLAGINSLFAQLKDSMDREFTAKIMKKQAEIDALQNQINPHFLYNTLESIRGQAVVEGADEIANMIEALSALFRYSISQRGSIVTLEDELNNVDNYLAIQQFRFNDKFNLVKVLDDSPGLLKYKLPKLIIQPIVENAIYHGLETKIGEGCITIRVSVTEKRLIINIADDGVGIEKLKLDAINDTLSRGMDYPTENDASPTHGIALSNVSQRIKLNFGGAYGLMLYSTPDLGTDVEISLPLIKDL